MFVVVVFGGVDGGGQPGFNLCFSFAPGFSKFFCAQGFQSLGSLLLILLSPRF